MGRPRADWVFDATLNPDFSQVELDVPQLASKTRFEREVIEKRPFFLESTDVIDLPVQGFYSRSITDPAWGLRATWRGPRADARRCCARYAMDRVAVAGAARRSVALVRGGHSMLRLSTLAAVWITLAPLLAQDSPTTNASPSVSGAAPRTQRRPADDPILKELLKERERTPPPIAPLSKFQHPGPSASSAVKVCSSSGSNSDSSGVAPHADNSARQRNENFRMASQ